MTALRCCWLAAHLGLEPKRSATAASSCANTPMGLMPAPPMKRSTKSTMRPPMTQEAWKVLKKAAMKTHRTNTCMQPGEGKAATRCHRLRLKAWRKGPTAMRGANASAVCNTSGGIAQLQLDVCAGKSVTRGAQAVGVAHLVPAMHACSSAACQVSCKSMLPGLVCSWCLAGC